MKKWMLVSVVVTGLGTTSLWAAAPFEAAVQSKGQWGTIDGQHKKIIPAIYDKVARSLEDNPQDKDSLIEADDAQKNSDLGLTEVEYKGLRGFYNQEGTVVVPVSYDRRSSWTDETLLIRAKGKYGYYASDGTVLAAPDYDSAAVYCEGRAGVGKNGKYGFLDKKGAMVIPLGYEAVGSFQEGLAVVSKNGKWGVIDTMGKEVIPCVYDEMQHQYENGYIGIRKNGQWGFADTKGTIAVAPAYTELIGGFHDGMAAVRMSGGYGFINTDGKLVASQLREIYTQFNEGLAAVRLKTGEKGYINKEGTLALRTNYDQLGPFENGLAEYGRTVTKADSGGTVIVGIGGGRRHSRSGIYIPASGGNVGIGIDIGSWSNGYNEDYYPYNRGTGTSIGMGMTISRAVKRGYMDRTGRSVISARLDGVCPMTEYGTIVKDHDEWGYVRPDGTYLVPAAYKALERVDELGIFLAKRDDGMWGILSAETGKVIVPFTYKEIRPVGEVLACKTDAGWGIMQADGILAGTAQYEEIGIASDDRVPVRKKKTWFYLDKSGQTVITLPEGTSQAGAFKGGYAPVKIQGQWGVVDRQGTITVAPAYRNMVVL